MGFLVFSVTGVASPDFSRADASDNLMQRWRGYALARITPDFAWATGAAVSAVPPTVMDRVVASSGRMAIPLGKDSSLALTLAWQAQSLATQPQLKVAGVEDGTPLLGSLETPFAGHTASTGLRQYFGDDVQMDFSVVLVQQRFAASYLGGNDYSATQPQPGVLAFPAASRGVGMELGMRLALAPRVSASVGYRSSVNMDSFQRFHGIYGIPGDIDVPARMHVGLGFEAAVDTRVRLGVDQIRYSGVDPFVSTALPRRVLAVLGDATSPQFQWQDLNIYSVSVAHWFDQRNSLSLRYSTGQQPEPTSDLLARLLLPEAADYSWGLSYTHDTGRMQWQLMANYAPAEFVLGMPTSVLYDNADNARDLEFEALWMWRF